MHITTHIWNEARSAWQGQEAAGQADLVLMAGQTAVLEDGAALAALQALYPGARVAACSTGTWVLDDQLDDSGAVATALRFDAVQVRAASVVVRSAADSEAAGQALARDLGGADLALVLVLSDGLAVNGTGLVAGLTDRLGPGVQIAGGLAGDGARFQTTLTALDAPARRDQIVAIGFYGQALLVRNAAEGGWDSFGPSRTISSASGATLLTLDGEPALDLYERYLGDEARDLPASALIYPLCVWPPGKPEAAVVRTVLSVDRGQRALLFAGDIPQGWQARLMRGAHDRLVSGAERAALAVAEGFPPVAGERLALIVSCVGRRLMMGQRCGDEVEAVQRALGTGTRSVGFYSYGELAPHASGGCCDLHNQTMTISLIGERAR